MTRAEQAEHMRLTRKLAEKSARPAEAARCKVLDVLAIAARVHTRRKTGL